MDDAWETNKWGSDAIVDFAFGYVLCFITRYAHAYVYRDMMHRLRCFGLSGLENVTVMPYDFWNAVKKYNATWASEEDKSAARRHIEKLKCLYGYEKISCTTILIPICET